MDIEISEQGINHIYGSIDNNISDFQAYIGQIKEKLEKINTAWQGTDEQKYKDLMEKEIKSLTDFYDKIVECTNYLKNVPGVYDKFDASYTNKKINF